MAAFKLPCTRCQGRFGQMTPLGEHVNADKAVGCTIPVSPCITPTQSPLQYSPILHKRQCVERTSPRQIVIDLKRDLRQSLEEKESLQNQLYKSHLRESLVQHRLQQEINTTLFQKTRFDQQQAKHQSDLSYLQTEIDEMRIIHDSQLREYEDRAVAQQESLECLKQESRSYRAIAERAEAMQTNLKRELLQSDVQYSRRVTEWNGMLIAAISQLSRWKHVAETSGWEWQCQICMDEIGDCPPTCCKGRMCGSCMKKLVENNEACPFCRQTLK